MKIRRLLKAAQNQLDMTDKVYRDNLFKVTGKRSSTTLNYRECMAVLDHFKALGYSPNKNPREGQIKRIQYLWIRLGEENKLDTPDVKAMYSFCRKFTGNISIYNAKREQLSVCIEVLKSWCNREQVSFNG
ncbi:MAG: regulatory protein GemA [Pseudomonas sp.]|nr:regulatory protein GemA [Pseudomonas sp.]